MYLPSTFSRELFDALFAEVADERAVLRQSLVDAEERESALFEQVVGLERLMSRLALVLVILCYLVGVAAHGRTDFALGFKKQVLCKLALRVDHLFYIALELVEHPVVSFRHRAGDDERRSGIVDQHRVNLIDDGVLC